MGNSNRWASEAYPNEYRKDGNRAIRFSGLRMDMFVKGKREDALDLFRIYENVAPGGAMFRDIGCGTGTAHSLIAPFVGSLYGTDVSLEAVDAVRAASPDVEYRVHDGERLPYEDASFDFCSTVCVMHHVPPNQWRSFAAEAWRVIRPGGLFAVY